MDGLLAFDLWVVVMEVLRSSDSTKPPTNPAARADLGEPAETVQILVDSRTREGRRSRSWPAVMQDVLVLHILRRFCTISTSGFMEQEGGFRGENITWGYPSWPGSDSTQAWYNEIVDTQGAFASRHWTLRSRGACAAVREELNLHLEFFTSLMSPWNAVTLETSCWCGNEFSRGGQTSTEPREHNAACLVFFFFCMSTRIDADFFFLGEGAWWRGGWSRRIAVCPPLTRLDKTPFIPRHQCLTVLQNLKLFLSMLVCDSKKAPIKQWEITVEKKRSMIKCREIEHAVKSKAPIPTPTRKETVTETELSHVDHVVTNAKPSQCEAQLYTFWRQRSSDQDDHKGQKSNDETRVQNPQSCVGFVVWQSQFGPQNPNPICWHQEPTRGHVDWR